MLLILSIRYSKQNFKSLELSQEVFVIYAAYFESCYFEPFTISNVFSNPMNTIL